MSLSAHLRRIGRLMEVLAYGEPTFLKREAERIMSKAREGLKNDAIKKKIIDFLEDDTPLGTGYGAYMAGLKGSSEEVYEMAEAIRDYAETQAMGLGHSRAELFGLPSKDLDETKTKLELIMKSMLLSMIKGSPKKPTEHIFEMTGKKPSKEDLERAGLRGEKYVGKS